MKFSVALRFLILSSVAMATETGLRERKKLQTRQLLTDTARRLFAERGFENVSVAEIARVADVSEATVFNYFPTKEDLVYGGLEQFEGALLAAVRDRRNSESVIDAFGRFILEPRGFFAAPDERTARELLAVGRMIAASPALLAREEQILARYTRALARLIADEVGAPEGDLRPYVTANALIGVHRALIDYAREQLKSEPLDRERVSRRLRKRGQAALELLRGGLGEYAPMR
jgi:AcrR family transcriptional regulator